MVTVRGGKGGSGAAALTASLRGPSSPSGGNGGPGGSIYLITSPSLTSLATLKKRVIGGQGSSGSGSFKHGRRGEDILITVPVGTIVRETHREGEEERTIREENEMGLDREERRKRRWLRWFITHPSAGGEVSQEEYAEAETLLRKEGRWVPKVPDLDDPDHPPIYLDLDKKLDRPILLATGGLGGLGNPFFTSPRIASRGILPPNQTFEFELKILSDVGLVGFPNSGKSTLLRALTGRKAEVADYEFTTLNPQIGVVRVWEDGKWAGALDLEGGEAVEETWREREDDEIARLLGEELPSMRAKAKPSNLAKVDEASTEEQDTDVSIPRGGGKGQVERIRFTLSDNPGLLPLASQNVGLGHSFLRSIERSPVLVYVLDLTRPDPSSDLNVLKNELEEYKEGLSGRAGIVVLNKADQVDEDEGRKKIDRLKAAAAGEGEDQGVEVIPLSGKYGLGVERLVDTLAKKVEIAREEKVKDAETQEQAKKAKREQARAERLAAAAAEANRSGSRFGLRR
ncbi:GTPase [Kwoniella heveanensis CBS 569]|nr:GTPase [Kwoniella heveanensis CBS 569]